MNTLTVVAMVKGLHELAYWNCCLFILSRTDGRLHEHVLYITQKCPCQIIITLGLLFVFYGCIEEGDFFQLFFRRGRATCSLFSLFKWDREEHLVFPWLRRG